MAQLVPFNSILGVMLLILWQLLIIRASAHLGGQAERRPVVEVPGLGALRGAFVQESLAVFRGIPYAKPPLRELRWKPPQPYGPWGGRPREASKYRDACIPIIKSPNVTNSEDCLFLNVVTPVEALTSDKVLPVMVYIHGGAYSSGASNNNYPESLVLQSKSSIVVVTLNYRLNVFGFLGSRELKQRSEDSSTGNYGLQDQRLALTWVRDYIKSFGGNCLDVTIFGESAGGNAVLYHLTQPASFGLYKKAIVQSGGFVAAVPLHEAQANFVQVLNITGCSHLGCLVNTGVQQLSDMLLTVDKSIWYPTIDGVALSGLPQELVSRGEYNKNVPVLLGSNRDEATLFMEPPDFPTDLTEQRFDSELQHSFLSMNITEVKRLFSSSFYPYPSKLGNFSQWWWELMRVATDGGENNRKGQPAMGLGHCSVRCLAHAFLQGGTPQVFTYLFSHPSQEVLLDVNEGISLFGTGPGSVTVPHASELPYAFGMVDSLYEHNGEADLARNMSAYWLQFATSGNPNRAGLPYWPSYDVGNDTTLILDAGPGAIRPVFRYHAAQCDFFDRQPHSVCLFDKMIHKSHAESTPVSEVVV